MFVNLHSIDKREFCKRGRAALTAANIDFQGYSGHSFRIGAITAAAAGVPVRTIKMLGRWTSDTYLLHVRTPRETLASVSQRIAN